MPTLEDPPRRNRPTATKTISALASRLNARRQRLRLQPSREPFTRNSRNSTERSLTSPPRPMSLEQAIAYIQEDELVEVTPKVVRIRKRFLDPHERKRASRRAEAA